MPRPSWSGCRAARSSTSRSISGRLADLRPWVRDRSPPTASSSSCPRLRPRLLHARAGYRGRLQMRRLLRGGSRRRHPVLRSGARHRMAGRPRIAIVSDKDRALPRLTRLALALRGGDDLTWRALLVTGGAGFIGSAVVRHLIARDAARGGRRRQADLRRQPRIAGAGRRTSDRYRFFHDDIADAARMARDSSTTSSPTWSCIWRPRATSTARSTAQPPSSRPTSSAPSCCSRRRLPTGAARRQRAAALPLPPRLDRRGVRRARRDRRASTRTSPYRPNSPYSASKAALGPSGARLARRPTACRSSSPTARNNFGPYQFPEKLIPLMILNALEGRELPVYGKGENVRDWLYVEDHVRALVAHRRARARRRDLPASAASGGRTNIDVVEAVCALSRRAGARRQDRQAPRPHPLRRRPARPRPPLRHRRQQDPGASSAGRRRSRSSRASRRRCAGTSTTATGGAGCGPTSTAASGWDWSLDRGVRRRRPAGPGADGDGRAAAVLRSPALATREADIADAVPRSRAPCDGRRPALVVNAAAYTAVDRAESETGRTMRANADGPAVVAAACAARGVPLVHISTDYVFDGDKAGAYREDDPVAPLSVYGRRRPRARRRCARPAATISSSARRGCSAPTARTS